MARRNRNQIILDCGGKRSATPLSPAPHGWDIQPALSARKRCRLPQLRDLPPQSKIVADRIEVWGWHCEGAETQSHHFFLATSSLCAVALKIILPHPSRPASA